jgi:hypothetical protein
VISELVADQRYDGADILQKVITHMKAEEDRHRQQFRDEKMENYLPHTLGYHFQKIGEATAGKTTNVGAALGRVSVQMIREALEGFQAALARRGLDDTWHLNESIAEVLYPLSEIEAFFDAVQRGEEPRLNERLVYFCSYFAQHRVESLRQTAREIDEQYQKRADEGARG